MDPYLFRAAVLVVVLGLAATGCGGSSAGGTAAGPGLTDLAPTYAARPDGAAKKSPAGGPARKDAGARPKQSGSTTARSPKQPGIAAAPAPATKAHRSRPSGRSRPGSAAAPSGPVRVSDPAGDVSTSAEGAPASADILGVQLTRIGDTVEVRTTFAGAVPSRQSGGKGMNVASFYDVDGNGIVDYEVWASIADNGWGTGYLNRRSNRASFGPSTGIRVSVEDDTLVTRFPADRIGDATEFRWSAASEWGSYESMAASTSARDYAPDEGAADYPG